MCVCVCVYVYASLHILSINQKNDTFLEVDDHDPLLNWTGDHLPSSPNTASRS